MLYRLKKDSTVYIAAAKDEKSVIANRALGKESVVDESGGVFLSALSHVPQSLDALARKLSQTFTGVDAQTLVSDAREFYDGFVRDGYLAGGETYAELNASEYGWGYDKEAANAAERRGARSLAYFHLPGLFEHYDFYKKFLFAFFNYREFFYDWAAIGSIYGCPAYTVWNSGRVRNSGTRDTVRIARRLTQEYGVSARFTFTNSLLEERHLHDAFCNHLLEAFDDERNGVILHSDTLLEYIAERFPKYYFVSSITKCLSERERMLAELADGRFRFVVTDYNFNNDFESLGMIPQGQRNKAELLVDESCAPNCPVRRLDYESVSRTSLYRNDGGDKEWRCPDSGARPNKRNFSAVKKTRHFIGLEAIQGEYLPKGFRNFKIEGRDYGELRLLEEILYYMVKPECQLDVREMMYLTDSANFPEAER